MKWLISMIDHDALSIVCGRCSSLLCRDAGTSVPCAGSAGRFDTRSSPTNRRCSGTLLPRSRKKRWTI